VAVHERHLELVFEVGYGPKPANGKRGAHRASQIDEESIELPHFNARVVAHGAPDESDALVDREQWLFGDVGGHRDHETIHEREAARDEIFVSVRDRVEAARVDADAHGWSCRQGDRR
jgi:hypothetical protein